MRMTLVYAQTSSKYDEVYRHDLDLGKLNAGLYFIKVQLDDFHALQKLVIQ